MLPEFPEAKKFTREYFKYLQYSRVASNASWMQAMGPPEPIQEGEKVILQRYDGSIDKVRMKRSSGKVVIKYDDLEEKGLPAILEAMDKAAKDMANQQTKHFITRLNEITEESGQVYDNQGRPLTFDTILDFLDKFEIDFDKQGHPLMPTIMAGPRIIEKIRNLKPTDEQNKKFNEIIERKYSEWRDRESNRRLVD